MVRNLDDFCVDVLQVMMHFICICEDGKIVWINDSGLRLLRAPNLDSVLGHALGNFISEDYIELFGDGLALLSEETEAVPLSILTTTADIVHIKMNVSTFPPVDGHERHMVECQDISALTRASQETRTREQRLRAVLRAVDQAVISIDEFGRIKNVNDITVRIFGYARLDMIGKNVSMLMPEPYRANHDEYLMRYLATGHSKVIDQTREFEGSRADGTTFPMEITVTELAERDGRTTFVSSVRDITIQKAQDDRIRFLALNDALTGLPNRASFNDRIEGALTRAERNGSGVALMFIDLDKFKTINDTLGHEAGDLILKTVADRLKTIIRKTDMAARLGGDEFVLVLENVANKEDVAITAKTILKKIPIPVTFEDTSCSVGASIGISHYPTDATTVPELLAAADRAMYKVKEAGRNHYSFC